MKHGFIKENRIYRSPASILLMIGFSISFTAVLIGVSSLNSVLLELGSEDTQATPVYSVMENTGMTLAIKLYMFSMVNCIAVSNYWILTKRREILIRKAFGWSDCKLIMIVMREIDHLLAISICISFIAIIILFQSYGNIFSIRISLVFVLEIFAVLVVTVFLAALVPALQIIKMKPVKGIS